MNDHTPREGELINPGNILKNTKILKLSISKIEVPEGLIAELACRNLGHPGGSIADWTEDETA